MPPYLHALRRSVAVASVAGLAVALLLANAPSKIAPTAAQEVLDYTPGAGALFNRPVGTASDQRAIFAHLHNTIDATPPGAKIRIAVFSFAAGRTATKLVAAHERGVDVQVIFNDHHIYQPERRLQAALGTNPEASSFARSCAGSCRGGKGQMHQKVFLFSRAGTAENVVMVGSNNMTRHNAVNQWSDLYTVVGDPALYFTYSGVFEQMKADQPLRSPYIAASVNGFEPEFYPRPGTTEADDPLTLALAGIGCVGADPGYGETRRLADGSTVRVTRLRISQHAWNGDRGIYLAKQVVALHRAGCDVRAVLGVGTGRVVRTLLDRAGVQTSSGRAKGVHTHQKVFSVSGVFEGNPASTIVWNGSHNWSDGALRRDDVVLRVDSPETYAQYLANFNDMWRNG